MRNRKGLERRFFELFPGFRWKLAKQLVSGIGKISRQVGERLITVRVLQDFFQEPLSFGLHVLPAIALTPGNVGHRDTLRLRHRGGQNESNKDPDDLLHAYRFDKKA